MKRIKLPVRSVLRLRVWRAAPAFTRFALGIALLSLAALLQAAELKLALFFGDHMVLQRERPICVWGDGETNAQVRVSVATREDTATVGSDGHWQARLEPLPAGGPYPLNISSVGRTIVLNEIGRASCR